MSRPAPPSLFWLQYVLRNVKCSVCGENGCKSPPNTDFKYICVGIGASVRLLEVRQCVCVVGQSQKDQRKVYHQPKF